MEDKTKSQALPERYDALLEYVSSELGLLPVGLDSAFRQAESRRKLAELKLRRTLKAYWSRPYPALDSLRPFNLLPLFQEYAEATFRAMGEECLQLFQDFEPYDSFLKVVEGWVLNSILPTPKTFEQLLAQLDERLTRLNRLNREDSEYPLKLETAIDAFKGKSAQSFSGEDIDRLTEAAIELQIIRLREPFSSYETRAEASDYSTTSWGGDWERLFDDSLVDALKQSSDSLGASGVAEVFGAALKSTANRRDAAEFWEVGLEHTHGVLIAAWWKMSAAAIRADSSPNSPEGIVQGTKFTDSASAVKLMDGVTAQGAAPNYEANRKSTTGAEIHSESGGDRTRDAANRRAAVDAFLRKCNERKMRGRATRRHIWQAVGHTTARQFEYWQASDPKASRRSDEDFRRILGMDPAKFESLLEKKLII